MRLPAYLEYERASRAVRCSLFRLSP